MKKLFIFLPALLVLSCSEHEHNKNKSHEHHDSTVHEHHHGHVNHHMNQRPFEELVDHFENPERDTWQQPEKVIAFLGDLKNKTVIDIGAGTAYFESKIKEPSAKLIAADVDDRFIEYMNARIKRDNLSNLSTRKAEYENPPVETSEADIVFMVDVYHHIENRVDYFKKVKSGLKPKGHLVIVDFKKGDFEVGPPDEMKLSASQIINEMKESGLKLSEIDSTSLKFQYLLKFE
ncbi:MAG: methyltransferase domain-containing protein [Bacteroidetes bacterium]|nr:methyltransferase domain-containing protein [Bacteroidota bacterium]